MRRWTAGFLLAAFVWGLPAAVGADPLPPPEEFEAPDDPHHHPDDDGPSLSPQDYLDNAIRLSKPGGRDPRERPAGDPLPGADGGLAISDRLRELGSSVKEHEEPGDDPHDHPHADDPSPSPQDFLDDSIRMATPPDGGVPDDPPTEVPSGTMTRESGSSLQEQIQRLGTMVRDDEPEDDPRDAPVPDPNLTPPPPVIVGEELEEEPCCGMRGILITYPVVTDPMEVPETVEAARDPAVGGHQVFLHSGAYFHVDRDFHVDALGTPTTLGRYYRSDLVMEAGGFLGDGWDFSFNKRIVPIGSSTLGNGLYQEQAGIDTARLHYYNGQGRAELYVETHSEKRKVINFDARFEAYVTTYRSPPGAFHEIQRYILTDAATPHPFAEHPDVEPTERIFYVLREKNGFRYIFNCRGQVIYAMTRNDSRSEPVRTTFVYQDGPLNPLTNNRMLTRIIDASGHRFSIEHKPIGQASYFTNIFCKLETGTLPIPRIAAISGEGLEVRFSYREEGGSPLLEEARLIAGDIAKAIRYRYDADRRLSEVYAPREAASGGPPYVRVQYDAAGRVQTQRLGDMAFRLRYAGMTVFETNALGDERRYELEPLGPTMIVKTETLTPADGSHGGPWVTRYSHNDDSQVTSITFPRGNRVAYRYDTGNEPVTLGPIRNWRDYPGAEDGLTYENNLSKGNLLEVTYHGLAEGEGTISSSSAFEPLYNQIVETVDARGNKTSQEYRYDAPREFGNPVSRTLPTLTRPDGSTVEPPAFAFSYNEKGQIQEIRESGGSIGDAGHGEPSGHTRERGQPADDAEEAAEGGNGDGAVRVTRFIYEPPTWYLIGIEHPDGQALRYERDSRGLIAAVTRGGVTTSYTLDGAGRIVREVRGGDEASRAFALAYDLNDNLIEIRETVVDHFKPDDGGPAPQPESAIVTTYDYDLLNRLERETVRGGGMTLSDATSYDEAGRIATRTTPSQAGDGSTTTAFSYDARGNVVSIVSAQGTSAERVTRLTYDDNGNQIRSEVGHGEAAQITTVRYDGFDRATGGRTPLGADIVQELDEAGNVLSVTISGDKGDGAAGTLYRAQYRYDELGHRIERRIDDLRDGDLHWTQWFYDGWLDVGRIRNTGQQEYRLRYDAAGRILEILDPAGNRTVNSYDVNGRQASMTQEVTEQNFDPGTLSWTSHATSQTWSYGYDGLGRMVSQSGPGIESRLFYNSMDQVRGAVSNGMLVEYAYDGLGRRERIRSGPWETRYVYNDAGLVEEVEASGRHERWTYDALGQVLTATNLLAGATTSFERDALGNPVVTADPNGTEVRRTFNPMGQPLTVLVRHAGLTIDGADGPIPALFGATGEEYRYDALGRLVRTSNDQGSVVALEYDGLGRATREEQTLGSYKQTIERTFRTDSRAVEVRYPEIAGSPVVATTFDPLGRIETIQADGDVLAQYLYAGLDRIAGRQTGNGVLTAYGYDDLRRLTEIRVHSTTGPVGPRPLWVGRATYEDDRPAKVVRTHFGGAGIDPSSTTTWFGYDAIGRTISTRTELSALDADAPHDSFVRSEALTRYRDGRVAAMAEYVLDVPTKTMTMARFDRFGYDSTGRVETITSTVGKMIPNAPATGTPELVGEIADRAPQGAKAVEQFTYDANGNLRWDSRYVYVYDYRDRLTRIEDTQSGDQITYLYDNFDRRIAAQTSRVREIGSIIGWSPPREYFRTWYIYDGNSVVAEAVLQHPLAPTAPKLMARYFLGALPGERVRMDRRMNDDPSQPFHAYYPHGDFQGTVQLFTGGGGEPLGLVPRTATQGGHPEDRLTIGTEDTKTPYAAEDLRIDSFSGLKYNEAIQAPVMDYRAGHTLSHALGLADVRQAVTQGQNRGAAFLAAATAAPFIGPYAITFWKAATAGAVIGGTINVGLNAYAAAAADNSYGLDEASSHFMQGAIAGAGGGVIGAASTGLLMEIGLNYLWSLGYGVTSDVAMTGADWREAVANNLQSAALDGALGFSGARLATALRSAGARMSARSPVRRAIALSTTDLESRLNISGLRAWWRGGNGRIQAKSALNRHIERQIRQELEHGTEISAEVARRLASGELTLELKSFQADAVAVDFGVTGARGYHLAGENVIHINTDKFVYAADRKSVANITEVAGTIVHEGIHALGGGEIAAHVGQGQFLNARVRASAGIPPTQKIVTYQDAPYLKAHYVDLLNFSSANMKSIIPLLRHIRRYGGYGGRHSYYLHGSADLASWVLDRGGWSKLLGIEHTGYEVIESLAMGGVFGMP